MIFNRIVILVIDALIISFICLQVAQRRTAIKQILFLTFGKLATIAVLSNMYFLVNSNINFVIQIILMMILIAIITTQDYKTVFLSCILGLCMYIWIEDISSHLFLFTSRYLNSDVRFIILHKNILFWFIKVAVFIVMIRFARRLNCQWMRYGISQKYINEKGIRGIDKNFALLSLIILFVYFVTCYSSKECFGIINCTAFYKIEHMIIPNSELKILLPLLAIIIIIKIITTIKEHEQTTLQVENLKYVEELINTNRSQRHDFNHHLQVIYGLMEMESFDRAKDYIKKSINEITEVSEIFNTDNNIVTALLHTKNCIAVARGVKLNFEVKTTLANVPILDNDLVIVLGNLIDNAIDAVSEERNTQKIVWVLIDANRDNYIFEVRNYNHSGKFLDSKIFLPGYTTKRKGKGMGLYSVKRVVNEYKGKVFLESDDKYTVFRVNFPKDTGEPK